MSTIIYKCVVGSKMHGLDTPDSDTDTRYITASSVRDIISPFKSKNVKVTNSDNSDVESWELAHFVKHLSSGNPTMFEVIKSPLYDRQLPYSDNIHSLMPLCLDNHKILKAHIGYADAQLNRYLNQAWQDLTRETSKNSILLGTNKYENENGKLTISGTWSENHIRRIPKSIVAAYRVLAQAMQLLGTGDFEPVISDYSPVLHKKLMKIKSVDINTIDLRFITDHITDIETYIQQLNSLFYSMSETAQYLKPDIDKIEDVLCKIYGVQTA